MSANRVWTPQPLRTRVERLELIWLIFAFFDMLIRMYFCASCLDFKITPSICRHDNLPLRYATISWEKNLKKVERQNDFQTHLDCWAIVVRRKRQTVKKRRLLTSRECSSSSFARLQQELLQNVQPATPLGAQNVFKCFWLDHLSIRLPNYQVWFHNSLRKISLHFHSSAQLHNGRISGFQCFQCIG